MPESVGQPLLYRAVHEQFGRIGEYVRSQLLTNPHVHIRSAERRRDGFQVHTAAVVFAARRTQGPDPGAHLVHRIVACPLCYRHLVPRHVGIRITFAARKLQAHADLGQPVPQSVVQLMCGPRAFLCQHELLLQRSFPADLCQGGVIPGQDQTQRRPHGHEDHGGDGDGQGLHRPLSQGQPQGQENDGCQTAPGQARVHADVDHQQSGCHDEYRHCEGEIAQQLRPDQKKQHDHGTGGAPSTGHCVASRHPEDTHQAGHAQDVARCGVAKLVTTAQDVQPGNGQAHERENL